MRMYEKPQAGKYHDDSFRSSIQKRSSYLRE